MDDLFHILSSSARIDKSKRHKKRLREDEDDNNNQVQHRNNQKHFKNQQQEQEQEDDYEQPPPPPSPNDAIVKSRDKTGKRDTCDEKKRRVQQEQMIAFRRLMKIKIQDSTKNIPDAISKFEEIQTPQWIQKVSSSTMGQQLQDKDTFTLVWKLILQNIEAGDWKEPTPIQMQGIPTLMERRDVLASAPTGSGKSGAFIIPALVLSAISSTLFYHQSASIVESLNNRQLGTNVEPNDANKINNHKKKKIPKQSRKGEIRALLLAPSRELAHQLHREVERLGRNRPGGLTVLLLQRSNASQLSHAGGDKGLDVLITTPLRLVDVLEHETNKGKLDAVRLVVLDEADRLLDATDLKGQESASGSSHTKTFISQMDSILNAIPSTAVRALFSATITPAVKELSESILRNACQISIQSCNVGGANTDIAQELLFCGREEGKLLAIRQLVARGQLHPPTLIFCQSQERAQALFSELLYDNLHVDVLHAGRSSSARERTVQNFRTGHTWVLICTDLVARGVDFFGVKLVINYDLPTSGVTYVHRIGRTGRAGRKGKAITFFTEADFDNLRAIANIMEQSGCHVPKWMLQLKKQRTGGNRQALQPQRRSEIDTTPRYDKMKNHRKQQIIEHQKKKKEELIRSKDSTAK